MSGGRGRGERSDREGVWGMEVEVAISAAHSSTSLVVPCSSPSFPLRHLCTLQYRKTGLGFSQKSTGSLSLSSQVSHETQSAIKATELFHVTSSSRVRKQR